MKIIASDYDGTITYGGIDDEKRDAIKRWRQAGNLFGLVSGRGMKDLVLIPEKGQFECDFLLGCNGAVIAEPDGKIIKTTKCLGTLARPLVSFLYACGSRWANVQTAFDCIIEGRDEERLEGEYSFFDYPEKIPFFYQISTRLNNDNEASAIAKLIDIQFGKHLNPLQNGRCIDIVSAQMNKARGIYDYMEIVGAKYEDVIAVGDNINDIAMIKEFRSYAMENAVEAVKKEANYQTSSITELINRELN